MKIYEVLLSSASAYPEDYWQSSKFYSTLELAETEYDLTTESSGPDDMFVALKVITLDTQEYEFLKQKKVDAPIDESEYEDMDYNLNYSEEEWQAYKEFVETHDDASIKELMDKLDRDLDDLL